MISIVIPTHKRNTKLVDLLNSLKIQNNDFEVIVVNNNTQKLDINDFEKHIKIIDMGHNSGIAKARSEGAKVASSEYILFIDDDNIIEPESVFKLKDHLQNNDQVVAVGPKTFYLGDKNKVWFIGLKVNLYTSKHKFVYNENELKGIALNLVETDNLHNCFMVKKSYGNKVSWFDEKVFVSGTELDFFLKLKKQFPSLKLATAVDCTDYHNIEQSSQDYLRNLGFSMIERVYYLQRNRGLITGRYGSLIQKITMAFSYPFFLILYGIIFIKFKRFDYLKSHLKATLDGYFLLFSLKKL